MDKSRPALAQKPSRGNLPMPYVLIPLKSSLSATRNNAQATTTKPKPGLAGLRQQVKELNARPVAGGSGAGANEVGQGKPALPVEATGAVVVRRNAQRAAQAVVPPEQQHAAATNDAPKPPSRPSPVPRPLPSRQHVAQPPPRIPSPKLVPPPPAPDPESDSDLSYVTVDDDGVPLRPLPAHMDGALVQANASLAAGPRRVVEVSPIVLPPAFRVDPARKPAPEPGDGEGEDEEDVFASCGEAEEEEEEEEVGGAREEDFPSAVQQPRRRPYQPRNGQAIDYDVELQPEDMLAAFLQADRDLKQTRPRQWRRNVDDDDEAAAKDEGPASREEVEESGVEGGGSDEELPDISEAEVVARKAAVGKGASRGAVTDRKGKDKARRSLSIDDLSPTPTDDPAPVSKTRRTTSRGAKSKLAAPASAVDSDDNSLDLPPEPVPKAKKKKVAVKGKGKESKRESDEDGPVDTEALLGMLPRRKRRVILVASDSDAESEGQGTDYDEEAEIRKTAKAKGRKGAPAKAKKATTRSAKSAPKKTRKFVEETVDSEVDRRREKRIREYKELDDFEMPTETVA